MVPLSAVPSRHLSRAGDGFHLSDDRWSVAIHVGVPKEKPILGILEAQDAETIVLVDAEGKERPLARARIRQFRSSAISLMPEGFKKAEGPGGLPLFGRRQA